MNLSLLTLAQRYIWLLRPDVQGNPADEQPIRICDFLHWWFEHGIIEYPAFASAPTDEQYAALVAPAFSGSSDAPPISNILFSFWRKRSDLMELYPLETAAGRVGFGEWLLIERRAEDGLQDVWIDQSLRKWFLETDPDVAPLPRLALAFWRVRPALQTAFGLANCQDRERFWEWLHRSEEWTSQIFSSTPGETSGLRSSVTQTEECATLRKFKAPTHKEGVNLIGFASAEFGIGEDLRMAAQSLVAAGIEFAIFETSTDNGVQRSANSMLRFCTKEMPYSTSILCMPPFDCAEFYLKNGREAFEDRFVIGYWPWELPDWPAEWASAFELVQEIWASSRFIESAFKRSAPLPVLHMPMAVDMPFAEPRPRARFALREGVFQFLFIFDWNSWPARKNPTAVVEAFRLAFPLGTEPVGLAIKMIGARPWSADFSAFRALADADRRITLLTSPLQRSVLSALYKCCDAYVSLHRAEGFGRTLAEAMLLGKPVVATNWSGNTDFLDNSTGCPVDFKLRSVEPGEYPHGEGQVWAEPDLHSAADWLRWLAADRGRASRLGRCGQRRIMEQYGVRAIGSRYADRLQALWQSYAERPLARAAIV